MGAASAGRTQVPEYHQELRRRSTRLPEMVRRPRQTGCAGSSAVAGVRRRLLTAGAKPATATARHLAVRRFSAWLTEEGEQDSDPLLGLSSPKLDKPVIEPLSDDQLRALFQACRGPDMRDKRDEALLRLMFTTGARAGEVVAMEVGDLNLRSDPPTVIIRRGKGGKGRIVPLAVEVAAAIDRYLRARRRTD